MAGIELSSVCKTYAGGAPVIRNVDLQIRDGEFCVFVGPSGCGKSTLLRMVAGLEEISAGELRIGGQRMNDTPPARRGVAMVFQSYALFPHLTVRENLAFGLTLAGVDKAVIGAKVDGVAAKLQLETLLERKPKALSGGQRQRVAIGRAIMREPGVFLFDEPLSNLDAALRVQTRFEIAKIHREFGRASTIYVTHDQVEAMTLADRILLLNAGEAVAREGSVAQCGSPLELYHRPRNLFVAGFIGSPKMNFLPATLVEGRSDGARVRLATGELLDASVDAAALPAGAPVTVGVRPEHAEPGAVGQHVVRELRWQERLGEATYLYLDGELTVKAPGQAHGDAGQRIAVTLPSTQLHLFDAGGLALRRCVPAPDLRLPVAA
ncbi:ABC transporter ATP-binding protein [Roseateles saccharophilus]|uniref:Carbohydrate ABC transporter ATP-binding protein (CUT1 family) n=1 Tax=Roseateles saccharophilus TaxID=304 RepID=A0A4R3VEX2_ROSSA|nr:ATP-binding cassette domain-containing protein [Roseateles saccharophilus]MDG0835382.1 ATP-binding cassette domain-containing protein [Roseateles saccharophilus]TCV02244.1 carbohydrate ABC transporter ATP-binding protein (CUT1 family) [Roseateles saccharophilus]